MVIILFELTTFNIFDIEDISKIRTYWRGRGRERKRDFNQVGMEHEEKSKFGVTTSSLSHTHIRIACISLIETILHELK